MFSVYNILNIIHKILHKSMSTIFSTFFTNLCPQYCKHFSQISAHNILNILHKSLSTILSTLHKSSHLHCYQCPHPFTTLCPAEISVMKWLSLVITRHGFESWPWCFPIDGRLSHRFSQGEETGVLMTVFGCQIVVLNIQEICNITCKIRVHHLHSRGTNTCTIAVQHYLYNQGTTLPVTCNHKRDEQLPLVCWPW